MSSDHSLLDAVTDEVAGVVPPCKSMRAALAVMRIAGDGACDFLHGQFSADMRALQTGHTLLTAWCSPKGRVLFLPRVLRATADTYFALLPTAQSAAFVKRLRMFVLRAKVQIEDCTASDGVLVIDGAQAPIVTSEVIVANDGERRWLLGPREQLARLWDTLPLPAQSVTDALLTDIARGEAELDASLSDQFLPQELNLDALAGVSFNKGCYPGQEIIARVKFRGTVKRRVQRVRLATTVAPPAGTRLLAADDSHHGTVLSSAACAAGHCEALAVIDVDVDVGALHLAGATAARLEGLALPYALTGA